MYEAQSMLKREKPPPAVSGRPPCSAEGTTWPAAGMAAMVTSAATLIAIRLKNMPFILSDRS
jgi:hypothetical protein